ncbi:MAG TPA: type II toxin-antitoxin system HicB family antitoxin [Gemmatales bacterium]|nr:type II toxin-antitoxin system HicB family antitoxin [Gemmatales bacterium]
MKRYAIVMEKAKSNYAAYVPDLPGCVATGKTVEATERRLRKAIQLHVRGLVEDGLPVPKPSSRVNYLEVTA